MTQEVDPVLVQYQIFSERKLHFGRLLWQIPAVFLALLVAVFGIVRDGDSAVMWYFILLAGGLSIEIAFVARRLQQNEDAYEQLMLNIERGLQERHGNEIQIAPLSRRFGARSLVGFTFAMFGFGLIGLGLWHIAT